MENRNLAVPTEPKPNDGQNEALRTNKKSKAFYNKWWFWLIMAFLIITLFAQVNDTGNGNGSTGKADTPAAQAEEVVLTEDEYKAQCTVLAYDAIARNPADYTDQKVTFKGKVIQVQESGKKVVLRVNVTEGNYGLWDDTIYVEYKRKDDAESRILEEDIITLYGTVKGIKKYTAVLGQQVSLPHIQAEYIDIS